jgi:hypothetical protein
MKNYYAFSYSAGIACNSEGNRYGTYYAFSSRKERDEFVANGGDFTTSPDWRESILSKDSELRSVLRRADRLIKWGENADRALEEVGIITN